MTFRRVVSSFLGSWAQVSQVLLVLSLTLLVAACSGSSGGSSSGGSGSGGSGGSGGGSTTQAAPVVTSVSPTSVSVGSSAFTLAITGTGFQAQSVVNWNSTALATTFISSSSLTAAVPANLAASSSVVNITVTNPDGQKSTGGSSQQQVSVANPAPTLSTISPLSLFSSSADTTFSLTGTNFNSSSVVMVGSTALSTTLLSPTQVSALAPAALLASPGTLSFTVSNPAPGGGSSQSLSVTVRQSVPQLTTLSPSTGTAGSQALTVTLTGSYFTPTAAVYFGNTKLATSYVSATSLQFTVPAQNLTYAGNVSVVVRDPASTNYPSNVLTFQVVNPVPVLSSILPGTVTAGAPNFTLTLTGSNFLTSSTVLVNGVATQPNIYPPATSATVFIPASAVSAIGTVTIAISNPAPGGGTSAPQTLNVIDASNRVRVVNALAADLGWDSAHSLLIASTSSNSPTAPNSIIAIDPLQGTVTTTQALPSQPAGLSITDDNSFVYVTLPSTGQIERLKLPSLTPDITFSLGKDSYGRAYSSSMVAAAPGAPHTVALAQSSSSSPGIVVVYDDGVARANVAVPTGYPDTYGTVIWGADATTLYGTNPAESTADEDTFSVDSNGVTLSSDRIGALGEFLKRLVFDTTTGRLVDGYGNVIDALSGQSIGKMQIQNTLSYTQNPFVLDSSQRVAYYLDVNGFYTNPPNGEFIEAFDFDTFTYRNSMLIDGLSGGATIVRWGTSGLAINAGKIYLIDGSFVAPSGVSSPVGGYLAPNPTLTSISPAAVNTGSPDVQVTLTGRDFTEAAEVTWNNQPLLIDSITDTEIIATIPASSLATAKASGIFVSNGPGTGNSNSLAFTVLPNLGTNTQISTLDISGRDLAWDSSRNLLYVAVPESDPVLPNTIAVVDPATATIKQAVGIPDGPTAISLSDDGQFLYSGFSGQAMIQRYSLPSFSLDLTIPTGTQLSSGTGALNSCSFPVEIKAVPGNAHSFAVTEGNVAMDPQDCGGIMIYDDATLRPDRVMGDYLTLAWGADTTKLYTQSDPCCTPQDLNSLSVSASGVSYAGPLNRGGLGFRVHFDAGTNLLYSDSGVITNPVGPSQVGKFSAGGLVATDSTLKRAYVLSTVGSSNAGAGAITCTLNIFDLNTLALLNTITIPDVLGTPLQMIRWGSNGIAFVTIGQATGPASAGVLYLIQGSSISGS